MTRSALAPMPMKRNYRLELRLQRRGQAVQSLAMQNLLGKEGPV